MNWADFKAAVLIDLPMDRDRIGIATGNPNYLEHQLLYCVIQLQKLVPFYQAGHETIYGSDDLVRDGMASVGSLPNTDQCRPQDAYFKRTGKQCVSQPLYPYDWGNRYDLICGSPRMAVSEFYIAMDPQAKQFMVFPSVGNNHQIVLSWNGIKLSFDDADETPFEEDVAESCGLFIKSKLSKLVDHDLVESAEYFREFLRSRGLLYADTRDRSRLALTASSPSAPDNCANRAGVCLNTGACTDLDNGPVEDTVEFCAFGDSGEPVTIANTLAVANLVKSLEPDFILQLGDINYPNGDPVTIQDNLLKYYGLYIPRNFLFAYGNHDVETDNGDALAALFTKQAALNNGLRYYDYIIGHLHLFVINSETPTDQDMWDWLEAGLEASDDYWNVVAFHKAPYSSDVNNYQGQVNMRKPFKDWGAHVVICGHAHNYERIQVDDFPYIVSGLGGATKRPFHSPPVVGSQFRYTERYGALWVTVRQHQLQMTFFNTLGDIVDSLALEHEPAVA